MRQFNKIFCVGWAKTGTSSLRRALEDFNLKVAPPWTDITIHSVQKTDNTIKEYFDQFDVLNPTKYQEMERLYPNSLYICTYHNPIETAYRMAKHNYNKPLDSLRYPESVSQDNLYQYGWSNYKEKIHQIIEHYDGIFKYFYEKRERFLTIDIIREPKASYELLCEFLQAMPNYETFPHINKNKLT
jgi:hypothetical protein